MFKRFATVTAGLVIAFSAVSTVHSDATQHRVPDEMITATLLCAPVPAGHARQACESIALRPAGSTWIAGPKRVKAFVKGLLHDATLEARPHSKAWNEYVRNGLDNEINSPEN